MTWALALAVLLQEKYDKAAERVLFPEDEVLRAWSSRGEIERRLIGQITDRKVWAAAFRQIDEKLGLFSETSEVKVALEESSEDRPARGGGRRGRGGVRFNMRKLVDYFGKLEELSRLEREGKRVRWQVPPVKFETMVTHELVHVFCGSYAEKWLTEGVACYVAGDTSFLYAFQLRGGRVDGLDKMVPDEEAYPRGMAFFAWMEAEWGKDKVREFVDRVTHQGEAAADAAAAVTGRPWPRLVLEEKAWSAAYVAKFKAPPE